MGLAEQVVSLATRIGTEIKSVRASMVTLTGAQRIQGVKQFDPGTLLMRSADGTQTAEPYSDINAPGSFEMTVSTTPANPSAGEAVLWTPDGLSLQMKSAGGTVTNIGPSTSTGGASSPTARVVSGGTNAADNEVILANASTASFVVNLPTPTSGRVIRVKKTDSSTNSVSVTATSGNIDGQTSRVLDIQYASITVFADGANWNLI